MNQKLLNEEELEWSPIVANNSMNRERVAIGVNSYEKELKLNPLEFISNRAQESFLQWTDLCCGRGNALIHAADYFKEKGFVHKLSLVGIDLVEYFSAYEPVPYLSLKPMNLMHWKPDKQSDLITIVHGLHYIGDKLDLVFKSAAVLKEDGVFIGNLDLNNIKIEGIANSKKVLLPFFRKKGIAYNSRTKIIKIEGRKLLQSEFVYVGADDKAGPNYTGQAVVNSMYKCIKK